MFAFETALREKVIGRMKTTLPHKTLLHLQYVQTESFRVVYVGKSTKLCTCGMKGESPQQSIEIVENFRQDCLRV